MLKEENVYPTYFDTSSCAEHRWEPLHRVLAEYLSASGLQENKQTILEKIQNDSKYRHRVLLENQHIVTSYFDARHINYENTFLKDVLQYNDSWSRYEFAKSRGQIHSHSLYFSKDHYRILKGILDQDIDSVSKANLEIRILAAIK